MGSCETSSRSTPQPTPTAGLGSPAQLQALALKVESSASATYRVTYVSMDQGQTATFTIEQRHPKLLIGLQVSAPATATVSGLTYISDGTNRYTCYRIKGKISCLAGNYNPLVGIPGSVSPKAALAAMQAAPSLTTGTPADQATFSSESFAGQSSTCLTLVGPNGRGTAKYCITAYGFLAYQALGANKLELTSYSSSVSDSDFKLPGPVTQAHTP